MSVLEEAQVGGEKVLSVMICKLTIIVNREQGRNMVKHRMRMENTELG